MEVIDIYVSETRDKNASKIFLEKCRATTGRAPESIRTDEHNGYIEIKELFPDTRHHQVKCLNNKAESSHVPFKQRYRATRGFKSLKSMARICECFEDIYRYFRGPKNGNQKHRQHFSDNWHTLTELAQVF